MIEKINQMISELPEGETNHISDGFHTFGELYDHRITLFLALVSIVRTTQIPPDEKFVVWWSRRHHDDTFYPGWVIVGVTNLQNGQMISYHIPHTYIKILEVTMNIPELKKAPMYDGHTPDDVIKRLKEWFINN